MRREERGSHRQRACALGNEAMAILRMSKILNSHFSWITFAHNTGLVVRAFQLFSVAALNRDDGSFNARRHASTKSVAGSLSSIQSRKSLRLPSLISRRTESPATIKARAADERGRLSPHSTSGSDSRTSRKLVNFRTLTWQSSQGESKEDSGPPTF